MPIHINLLAEAQAAEELRRRDPVKRALFIGVSLVVVSLVWSGIVEINAFLAQERLAGVQGPSTPKPTRSSAWKQTAKKSPPSSSS